MQKSILFIVFLLQSLLGFSQFFNFSYSGPDTLYVNEDCGAILDWGHPDEPQVSSNIGAEIDSFYIFNISGGYELNESVPPGTYTISYRVVDSENNSQIFSFSLQVVDTIPPVLIHAADVSVSCETPDVPALLEAWYNANGNIQATDNCGLVFIPDKELSTVISLFSQSADENCGNTRSVTVIFAISDMAGNSIPSVSLTFETVDVQSPVFTVMPEPLVSFCDENIDLEIESWIDNLGGAQATDNCSEILLWEVLWNDNDNSSGRDTVGHKPYRLRMKRNKCQYAVNLNFIAIDECGNKKASFTTIQISDNNYPVFSEYPADTTVDVHLIPPQPDIAATDPCKGDLIVLLESYSNQHPDPSDAAHYNYTIEQIWSADDGCNHLIQHVRDMIVVDTIPPFFVVPAEVTVSCQDINDPSKTGIPTGVSDNSGSAVEVYFEDLLAGSGCSYMVERHWFARDISGNTGSAIQIINVLDNEPPLAVIAPSDLSADCNEAGSLSAKFFEWLDSGANAEITDACSEVFWFAAEPGSYDITDNGTFPGLFPVPDFFNSCVGENSVMYEKGVDFVFYDACGNTLVFKRYFRVIDDQAPVFQDCPADSIMVLADGECHVNYTITGLLAEDFCESPDLSQSLEQSFRIRSQLPGDQQLPVDTTTIQIGPFNLYNLSIDQVQELTLEFRNMDANDPNEYFVIRGEDGSILGTTPIIDEECGDFAMDLKDLVSPELLEIWLADGYLTLILEPVITTSGGAFSINDICTNGSSVLVSMNIDMKIEHPLQYFISVGDSQYVPFETDQTMEVLFTQGNHVIRHKVTDCAGNETVCIQNVLVADMELPVVECPGDIELSLEPDSCVVFVQLPMIESYADNCLPGVIHIHQHPDIESDAMIRFAYNEDNDEFEANNKSFTFTDIPSNIFAKRPRLTVLLQADVVDPQSYFEILDEQGKVLGITAPGSCDSITATVFELDEYVFHEIKKDGEVSFFARSVNSVNPINPCDQTAVLNDGDTDGKSKMYLSVSYEEIDLKYYISGATETGATALLNDWPVIVPFNGGFSNVHYLLTDQAGNVDTCIFAVNIIDSQAPKAICKEAAGVFIHPSGIMDYVLLPEEIDMGSFDNCLIDSMAVFPNLLDCSMAGSTIDVTLYVWDAFYNLDSCQTSVKVETRALEPFYTSGICVNDTLRLFANLPEAPDNIYTVLWTGPEEFSSDQENPVRPNASSAFSGTYSLEVTGVDGCASTGFVDVFIEEIIMPVLEISRDTLCSGDLLILNTSAYSGSIKYSWYKGIAPEGELIDTSAVSSITISPENGKSFYYVIAESQNCFSSPSLPVEVNVLENPVASVPAPFIVLCEGDHLILGTDVTGDNYQYLWTGPDSFFDANQYPEVIQNVGKINQGRYSLVISNRFCRDTAFVEVLVDDRPVKPVISSDTLFCEGEPIVFVVNNITSADSYHWYLNDQLYTVRNSNSWIIPAASDQLDGNWKVSVKAGNCFSEFSEVQEIRTEMAFPVTASSESPVCQGDSVQLFAPFIPGAQYQWIDPNNQIYLAMNPKVKAVSGTYRLEIITAAGCYLSSSAEVEVIEVPIITALSHSAEKCITGDECIEFVPTIFPPNGNYTYEWTGPADFVSNEANPVICHVDLTMNGVYTLVVSQNICASEAAVTEVEMFLVPDTPELAGTERVCANDTIVIRIQNYEGTGMFTYLWKSPDQSQYQTTKPELRIPGAAAHHNGSYYVTVFNGNCYSDESVLFEVEVIAKPNQPNIWGDEVYCEGEAIRLFSNYTLNADYQWDGPGLFVSGQQNPIIFPATLENAGVYRLRLEVDGCLSEYSDNLLVIVNPKPLKPVIMDGIDPVCIGPDTGNLQLCLQNIKPATQYSWYHNQTGNLLTQSLDPCITFGQFQGIADGLNGFYVVAEANGCLSDLSELVHVFVTIMPVTKADAGEDIFACDDEELFLNAKFQPGGKWSSLNPGVIINNTGIPASKISKLPEGNTAFIWTLSYEVCHDYSRDTVIVSIAETPDAIDDQYETDYNREIIFDPSLNDLYAASSSVHFDQLDFSAGRLEAVGGNLFRFVPDVYFIGQYSFPYTLRHDECPQKFNTAMITIDVGDVADCFGVNVITPNGDGINDILAFPCLATPFYPRNRLTVFNQWGDEVFSAMPYLNDWEGTYKGKDLPVGTYYYILDLGNGTQAIRNFVVIER